MKTQETKDAELVALAAVVFATHLQRDATNAGCIHQHRPPAYDDDAPWPELDALHAELRERGVLTDPPRPIS